MGTGRTRTFHSIVFIIERQCLFSMLPSQGSACSVLLRAHKMLGGKDLTRRAGTSSFICLMSPVMVEHWDLHPHKHPLLPPDCEGTNHLAHTNLLQKYSHKKGLQENTCHLFAYKSMVLYCCYCCLGIAQKCNMCL